MKLVGNVKIIKNGKTVFEKSNAIHNGLRTYFYDAMNAPTNKAIDDLFTDDGSAYDGSQAGKDGIVVWLQSGEKLSTVTTLETSTSTSRMWEGVYTNDFGGDKDVVFLVLGHNFSLSDTSFSTRYATIDLDSAGNTVELSPSDSIIIQWTISITV